MHHSHDDKALKVRRGRRARSALLLAFALCTLGGCATVAPYEREQLARPDMQFERDPGASAGEEHATAYREGSAGGFGASGGGCGCN